MNSETEAPPDANAVTPPDPLTFRVAVAVSFRESSANIWTTGQWRVDGVIAGDRASGVSPGPRSLHDGIIGEANLHEGYELSLYPDELESYYYNLTSDKPRLFVICRDTEQGDMEPALVSASYDEADAYGEGEESVFAVDMPPEIYRWIEQYVLANYVPERRKKRKRNEWKNADDRRERGAGRVRES